MSRAAMLTDKEADDARGAEVLPVAEEGVPGNRGTGLVTAPPGSAQVVELIARAVDKGTPVEALKLLQEMFHKEQDRDAAREYNVALSAFQLRCPAVPKTSKANIVSEAKGTKFSYSYAELDQIAETVGPSLHALGFSFSWDSSTADRTMTAVCTLRHRNGHSERASFSCPVDSAARMNAQQQHAAALTYAKRQALVQVLGLTMTDPDPDSAGAPGNGAERITDAQLANLEAMVGEVNANLPKLLIYLGVESLAGLSSRDYQRAVTALEAKRNRGHA